MDRIKELIASLDARGVESPFLERLRARRGAGSKATGGLDALKAEILAEMAASLGRAEDRINAALLQCELLGEEIDALDARGAGADERRAKVEAFNRQRDIAERRLWELTVQREALGLTRHDVLQEHYPLPPRRR